jgi:predicted TPR repeat methyltransferase
VLRRLAAPDGRCVALDAGCGTGLCGPLLRPYASELTGVDLSAGMLDRARPRQVYDHLEKGELSA